MCTRIIDLDRVKKIPHRQRHRYVRMIIVQTPITTPIMMESRRRRDFIIDTRLLMPGIVPMNDTS